MFKGDILKLKKTKYKENVVLKQTTLPDNPESQNWNMRCLGTRKTET